MVFLSRFLPLFSRTDTALHILHIYKSSDIASTTDTHIQDLMKRGRF